VAREDRIGFCRQAVAQLQWRVGELGELVGDDLEQVAWAAGSDSKVTVR
jgi:hypothetical protein